MRSTKAGSPGQLLDSATATATGEASEPGAVEPDGSLAALAAQYGLRPSAQRPSIGTYLSELARRWSFIMGFATARNVAMYTEAKLGQLWQVLAPLLNAGVYFLIFGVIIKGVSRGVPDYLPFLVTGVFVFSFTQRTFISTSKVITDSLPLIRALKFPRAALPLAYVMIELQQMLLSMAVLVVLVLAVGGEPLTWYWLLVVPALALLTMFNAGIGMFAARTGARVNDFAQLLPFLMRTWLYLSGVIYSVQLFVAQHSQNHGWVTTLLQINPAAIFITLVRNALLTSQRTSAFGAKPPNAANCAAWAGTPRPASVTNDAAWHIALAQVRNGRPQDQDHPLSQYGSAYCHPTFISSHLWLFATGWALVALLLGFWYFWRKEVNYGRG
jgi:teichoic acid transport system permease protein